MFDKYLRFKANIEEEKNKNLVYCINTRCLNKIFTNPLDKKVKCPQCNTLICKECKEEWHENTSCSDAME